MYVLFTVYIYYVISHLRKICYAYILYNINYMNINIYKYILFKYIRYVCPFKYTQYIQTYYLHKTFILDAINRWPALIYIYIYIGYF